MTDSGVVLQNLDTCCKYRKVKKEIKKQSEFGERERERVGIEVQAGVTV